MAIQLKPEQQQRIDEAIQSGAYTDSQDVIDQALEMLHERDEWLLANREQIREEIKIGIEQLERGEGIPDYQLDEALNKLKTQPK